MSRAHPYRHFCPVHGLEVCTCSRGYNYPLPDDMKHTCHYIPDLKFEGPRGEKWEMCAEIRKR